MKKKIWFNKQRKEAQIREIRGYKQGVAGYESVSKTGNVVFAGSHHSGKTETLLKLFENAQLIWESQCKPYAFTERRDLLQNKPVLERRQVASEVWIWRSPVWLASNDPLSKWTDQEDIAQWWDKKNPENTYGKIKAWKRPEIIIEYLKETRAVLFIDDAHKLTGRKLVIAKACFLVAFRSVMSCNNENTIPPSLRLPLLQSKPQMIQLNSEAAYDNTHILVWTLVFLLTIAGLTEAAALLAAFETLKGGRGAAKQN